MPMGDAAQCIDDTPTAPSIGKRASSIAAAVIGNTLEWFDILVYAFVVSYISANFFPADDPTVSTLMAFGTFGLSFIVRPLGGIVFGWAADRYGRKPTLAAVSALMFLGTAMIVVLPGYATIGVAAPLLLLLARLIQGFSAGGEFGSATAYLAEQSVNQKAFFSSWQFASQGLAILLAALFGTVLSRSMSAEAMMDWGWRVPFVFGLLVGPVAYFIRFHADESPEYEALQKSPGATGKPKLDLPDNFAVRVLTAAGLVMGGSVGIYLLIYMPTFAKNQLGMPIEIGFSTSIMCGLLIVAVPPVAGLIVDRVGVWKVALPSLLAMTILPFPLFLWMTAIPSVSVVLLVQGVLSFAIACYMGMISVLMASLFPTGSRTLGLSLSYNIAVVVGGAFAPLIFTLLIAKTGLAAAPGAYMAFAALLSLLSLLIVRRAGWK
jgi:MFS transporter, MHS family, proline/betaine transporter